MLFCPPLKTVPCTCILKELKTYVQWPSLFQAVKLQVAFLILYYSPNSDPHPIKLTHIQLTLSDQTDRS